MKKIISLLTAIVLSLTTFVCYAEGSEPDNVIDETMIIESEQQVEEQQTDTISENETVLENEIGEADTDDVSESVISEETVINDIDTEIENNTATIKYERNVKYKDFNIEKGTFGSKPYEIVEKITFDFVIDSTVKDSHFGDIASDNCELHGTLCRINVPDKTPIILLTLEGDNGIEHFWRMSDGLSWQSNWLLFHSNIVYDSGDLVTKNGVKYIDYIELRGFDNSGKTGIYVSIDPDLARKYTKEELETIFIAEEPAYRTIAENIVYHNELSSENSGNSLSDMFGLTREKLVEEAKKNQTTEEQDPERWVTKWKGVDANGDPIGYYVNFAAQFDVNLSGNTMPAWYKKLGDNVTATMPVLIRTYKGVAEKKINHPFMLLKGDKGYKWFMISKTGVSDGYFSGEYKNGKNPEVDIVFSELISFDGYNVVRNTVEYEQISAYIRYSDDGNLTPLGMELRVGGKSQYTEAEDIICIGEGGLSFDNIG